MGVTEGTSAYSETCGMSLLETKEIRQGGGGRQLEEEGGSKARLALPVSSLSSHVQKN